MENDLPFWLKACQALATPLIALIAAGIGYMQWHTAHRKTVIDLFEKRYRIYTEIRASVADIMAHGSANQEDLLRFLRAADGIDFLFGREVVAYIETLRKNFYDIKHYETMHKTHSADYALSLKYLDKQSEAFEEITKFYKVYPDLFGPYMRLDHKMPHWHSRLIGKLSRAIRYLPRAELLSQIQTVLRRRYEATRGGLDAIFARIRRNR